MDRGRYRIFSRVGGGDGGGGCRFAKICRPFFQFDQMSFSTLKTLKRPCFGQIFCAAGKILKKRRPKKEFLETFWKIMTKKLRFLGARSPLKIVHIGAFKKLLGSVTKYGYLKIVQRGFESIRE